MRHNKLKLYVPINESICKIGKNSEKENDIKFHGKPDKILPLINSEIENIAEKVSTNEMLLNFLK